MYKNLYLKKLTIFLASSLLIALIISACGPSPANNTKTTGNANVGSNTANANSGAKSLACDDAQVMKDMKATIDAKYPLLKARMTNLSAYSQGCLVSLWGYTDTLTNFKDFYKVASDTPNVQKVNVDNLFIEKSQASIPVGNQCPAGQQTCGDICVPMGQCWSKSLVSDANTNSNSNTGTNTNTNTNAMSNSYSNSNKTAKP